MIIDTNYDQTLHMPLVAWYLHNHDTCMYIYNTPQVNKESYTCAL